MCSGESTADKEGPASAVWGELSQELRDVEVVWREEWREEWARMRDEDDEEAENAYGEFECRFPWTDEELLEDGYRVLS